MVDDETTNARHHHHHHHHHQGKANSPATEGDIEIMS